MGILELYGLEQKSVSELDLEGNAWQYELLVRFQDMMASTIA